MAVATQYMRLGLVQLMGKHVTNVGKWDILSVYAETSQRRGKIITCRTMKLQANEMFVGLIVSGDEETKLIWNHKETTRLEHQVKKRHKL